LKQLEEDGQLHFMFTSPEVFLASLKPLASHLKRLIFEANIRRLVLDNVCHFDRRTADVQKLRGWYTQRVNGLRREQITGPLLGEDRRSGSPQAFTGVSLFSPMPSS
jgi:hypothetical protein